MPAEERKLVTVVFADLVGSTALAGDEDPERVRALLDRFYDSMALEIQRAGGTVEKFVGDAGMAAFGAPAAHEDDAERALHAALAMRHRLSASNATPSQAAAIRLTTTNKRTSDRPMSCDRTSLKRSPQERPPLAAAPVPVNSGKPDASK